MKIKYKYLVLTLFFGCFSSFVSAQADQIVDLILKGKAEEAIAIIEKGEGINDKNQDRWTPLMASFSAGVSSDDRLALVQALLAQGVDIVFSFKRTSTVELAIRKREGTLLTLLLQQGAQLTEAQKIRILDDQPVFAWKNACDYILAIHYLLQTEQLKRKDIRKLKTPLIHKAAYCGQVGLVELLLQQYGFDIHTVTQQESTPLHIALLSSDLDMIKYLLDQGANVNYYKKKKNPHPPINTLISYLIFWKNKKADLEAYARREQALEFLLSRGARLDLVLDRNYQKYLQEAGYANITTDRSPRSVSRKVVSWER